MLVVGLDHALPPPMQMGSPETGDFRGFEVDLLNEIAAQLQMELQYRRSFWSRIVEELIAGSIDVVCSAATISEERRRTADFTRPYLEISLATVSRGGEEHRDIEDDDGRIGVRRGTTAADYVEARHRDPALLSESNDELYDALSRREVDVIVDDSPIAAHFVRTTSAPALAMTILPETEAAYGMMLKKGSALRPRIDAVLESLDASGRLKELRDRWKLASP